MKTVVLLISLSFFMLVSCNRQQCEPKPSQSALSQLEEMMPSLGHRNWIVISDMAYPLQTSEGIKTLYTDQPYETVLAQVKSLIDSCPHVFAHVYRDQELSFIPEEDAPGITSLRQTMDSICGNDIQSLAHEEIIKRLDEAGKTFTIVIIKTPALIPYTTTFFELDCKYWDADRAQRLQNRLDSLPK